MVQCRLILIVPGTFKALSVFLINPTLTNGVAAVTLPSISVFVSTRRLKLQSPL